MKRNNISSEEWRWVALVSGILVTLTLLPYAWALLVSDGVYQFMGVLSDPINGATHLSKISQGASGSWLFEFRHTPQQEDGMVLNTFYLLLGHAATILGVSSIVVYHVARVITSTFMFFTFYQLGASIWERLRPRRWFFALIAVGSGLGWLSLLFDAENLAPDLIVPEAFPLLAAFTNPHYPLAIGCLALLATQLLEAFRPGYTAAPTIDNGGLLIIVLAVVLAFVLPAALIVISAVVVCYTFVRWIKLRQLPLHEARWTIMVIAPGIPFAAYYYAVFRFQTFFQDYSEQTIISAPNPILVVMGFGMLFLIAIPGMIRALRRFEADGDQLMLVWFVVNSVMLYIPVITFQSRLFVGMIIPIVYFGVRSLEDYWFARITPRWWIPSFVLFSILILPTHILTVAAPLTFTIFDREAGANTALLVRQDYMDALDWLDENGDDNDVVLASPNISLWLPALTDLRPVYGHPYETVPAKERLEQVRHFYWGDDCAAVFDPDLPFQVRYVLWGVQEDRLNEDTASEDNIEEIFDRNSQDTTSESPTTVTTSTTCRTLLETNALDIRTFDTVVLYILY